MQSNPLTEGSILSSLVKLSLPIIFINILQTAYQLIDTFWVGRLGREAVAAVSLSFPVVFLLISFGMGLLMSGAILVAQHRGRKDHAEVNHIAGQTLLMVLLISILLTPIGYFLSPFIVEKMGAEPAVFTSAVSYMQISFLGMVFLFFYMAFQSLMRGVGDVKTPMKLVLMTVLLNLVLDPLFIFGYGPLPGSGVTGAAYATILTQGLAGGIGVWMLLRGKHHISVKCRNLKPDWAVIKRMIFLGAPASLEHSNRALGFTIMTFLAAGFGTLATAVYGIGTRILSFIIIPAMGLAMATSTLVGQNIGAGKKDRAEQIVKLSALSGFSVLAVIGALVFLFAAPLAAAFLPGDPEAIDESAFFIRILAGAFAFFGIQMTVNGAFMGSGNTITSMLFSLISLWVIQFPLAYILSHHTTLGVTGIWIAFPISIISTAILSALWFAGGHWKKKELLKKEQQSSEQGITEAPRT